MKTDTKENFGTKAFLDGYKEENIVQNITSLNHFWDEIERSLNEMMCVSYGQSVNEAVKRLVDLVSRIKDDDMIEKSILLGEHIKSFVRCYGNDCPGAVKSSDFQLVIYSFLELAEMIADSRVVNVAVQVGEMFEALP